MTWVVADFTATPSTQEISVCKGQQVEVLDASHTVTSSVASGEFCLVRLSPGSAGTTGGGGTLEGLVPVSVLKPLPGGKSAAGTRRGHSSGADASAAEATSGAGADNNGGFVIVCE